MQWYDAVPDPDSATIAFHRDAGGPSRPGDELADGGRRVRRLEYQFVLDPVRLKPGRVYWMSYMVNMDFACCGQLGWEITSTALGYPAMFKNPGDGFGTGCVDWDNMQECMAGTAPGPDVMFSCVAGGSEVDVDAEPSEPAANAAGVVGVRRSELLCQVPLFGHDRTPSKERPLQRHRDQGPQ